MLSKKFRWLEPLQLKKVVRQYCIHQSLLALVDEVILLEETSVWTIWTYFNAPLIWARSFLMLGFIRGTVPVTGTKILLGQWRAAKKTGIKIVIWFSNIMFTYTFISLFKATTFSKEESKYYAFAFNLSKMCYLMTISCFYVAKYCTAILHWMWTGEIL